MEETREDKADSPGTPDRPLQRTMTSGVRCPGTENDAHEPALKDSRSEQGNSTGTPATLDSGAVVDGAS